MALLLAVYVTQAQVGIGTASPAASSQLEVTSTTKGFLPPRMTTAQRDAISTPATGLQIYNTDNKAIETFTGNTGEWLTVGQGKGAFATNTAIGVKTLFSNTTGTNNTANGSQALYSNTTGSENTANGPYALYNNTTGAANTTTGYQALVSNTTGSQNTANGFMALYSNTTGTNNTGIGYGADVASGALTNATAVGYGAIVAADNTIQLGNTSVMNVKTSGTVTAGAITYPNTDGTNGQVLTTNGSGTPTWSAVTATAYSGILPVDNGGTGAATLTANNVLLGNGTGAVQAVAPGTSGYVLTSDGTTWVSSAGGVPYTGATGAVNLGAYDLKVNGITVGMGAGSVGTNTAIGDLALASNTYGVYNTANGSNALASNTTGSSNTANGFMALIANTTGTNNTANGFIALFYNTTGNYNTANGNYALFSNTTGSKNTANGYHALSANTTGNSNTANGYQALQGNTTGTENTAIGYGAGVASGALTNATAIGNGASVAASNTIQLGNTSVTNVKTKGNLININPAVVPINTTATATAADIITGYIASTTAAAVNITLPTATDISAALGSSVGQGTSFEFSVENTGGSNSVTLVAGTGITVHAPIISGTDNLIITPTNAIGRFRLVFTSTTSAKLFRIY